MTNVIQGNFSKEEKEESIPACFDCRFYENSSYRVPVCIRHGSPGANEFYFEICKGRLFEPKPRTFWQRLGDAIIERVKR